MACATPAGFGESPRDTTPALDETVLAVDAAVSAYDTTALVTSDMSSLYYEKDVANAPILRFDERNVEFGTVTRGEKREHTYKFKNVGTVPATIALASACTCTTLEWTRGEIAPGAEGEVHAIFDSSEKSAGELITIDVILEESAPSGNGIVEQVAYTFEIEGEK